MNASAAASRHRSADEAGPHDHGAVDDHGTVADDDLALDLDGDALASGEAAVGEGSTGVRVGPGVT